MPSRDAYNLHHMTSRPPLPEEVARAVRKRCGFGCVICGCPIFQYDHIDGWRSTGHNPDEMTCLCPTHHMDKTAGRLPVQTVRKANANPVNSTRSFTAGHPTYFDASTTMRIEIGSFTLTTGDNSCGLIVDGEVAFGARVDNGHLRLDVNIDDMSGQRIMRVDDGVLRFASDSWDVKYSGTGIRIRTGARQIALAAQFNPSAGVIRIVRAAFTCRGVPFLAGPGSGTRGLNLPTFHYSFDGFTIEGGGIQVGEGVQGYSPLFHINE